MALILQSSTYSRSFLMVCNFDHFTASTSGGVTVNLLKGATGSWSLASGSAQINSSGVGGVYSLVLSPADTNTLGDLAYWCTGTGFDSTFFFDEITGFNPLTAIAATASVGSVNVSQWAGGTITAGVTGVPITDPRYWNGTAVTSPITAGQPLVMVQSGTVNNITGNVSATASIGSVNVSQWAGGTISASTVAGVPYTIVTGGTINNVTSSVVAGTIAQNPLLVSGGTIGLVNLVTTVTNLTNTVGLTAGTYAVNFTGSQNNIIQPVTVSSGTISQVVSLLGGTVNNVTNNVPASISGSVNVSQWAGGTIVTPITVGIPLVMVQSGTINQVTGSINATITGGTVSGVSNPVTVAGGTVNQVVNLLGGTVNTVTNNVSAAIGGSVNVSQWAGGTISPSTSAGVPYTIVVGGTINNVTSSVVAGTIAQTPLLVAGGTIGSVSGAVGSVTGSVGSVSGAVGSVTSPVSIAGGTYAVNLGGSVNNVINSVNITGGTISAVTGAVNSVTNPVNITGGTVNPVQLLGGTYPVNLSGSVNNVIQSQQSSGSVNVTQWAGGTITPSSIAGVPLVIAVSGTINNITNPVVVSGGTVNISSQQLYVKQNAALNGFMFLMVLSSDHVTPATGLTITSQVSVNGGAFNSTTNNATEIGQGVYTINLSAADTNGHTLMFLFSAATADNRYIEVVTQT